MSSIEASEKAVQLPKFDGTQQKWFIYWTQFQAYSAIYAFSEALQESTANLPETEATTGSGTEAAKKKNRIAIGAYTMSFTTEGLMRLIAMAKSADWPSGRAWLVTKALFKKFRPDDVIAKVELRRALGQLRLRSSENPAELFEQIAAIQNRYAADAVPETELISVVLSVAPEKYQSFLASEQRRKSTDLTLDDLASAMDQLWRQSSVKMESENEISLSSFTGTCFGCGKQGHKRSECPSKGEVPKCAHCGKNGHVEAKCWLKDSNEKPQWLIEMVRKEIEASKKEPREVTAVAISSEVDVVL